MTNIIKNKLTIAKFIGKLLVAILMYADIDSILVYYTSIFSIFV